MTINVDTEIEKNVDAAEGVVSGVRRGMRDAADTGFGVSQNHVPHGATSSLSNSGFVPEWRGNELVWGYSATYALDVEEGQDPHMIDESQIPGLKKWARRVLGNEGAWVPVWRKIAKEGTDAQPFIEPGVDAQKRYLSGLGLDTYVSRELD